MKEQRKPAARTGKSPVETVMMIGSQELPSIRSAYVCEDCDYKWTKQVQTSLEDSYNGPVELRLDDERTKCPICGSDRTNRYEG